MFIQEATTGSDQFSSVQEIAQIDKGREGLQVLAMPSREKLQQMGQEKLIRGIQNAGGFMFVAQQLGLRTLRKPNGYWDNIENLDEVGNFLRVLAFVPMLKPQNCIYGLQADQGCRSLFTSCHTPLHWC